MAFSLSWCAVSGLSPFDDTAPVRVEAGVDTAISAKTAVSLGDIVDRKNAIPNFPWNWPARDKVLLDGASGLVSSADIVALTRESGFQSVREKILLLGINTPKNFADVKMLYDCTKKVSSRDSMLIANAGKLSWDEALMASGMASSEAKSRVMARALGKIYGANRRSGKRPDAPVWLTDPAGRQYLRKQGETPCFGDFTVEGPAIEVDEARAFQAIDGFGFALTGGSAYLLSSLSAETRKEMLKKFFLTDKGGIGVSSLRLSIGASDLSRKSFSYVDQSFGKVDPDLSSFNIMAGDREVIPVMKEILALRPDIRILATPWSAPPWMKTKRSFKGGSLKPEYYSSYADYFVKYLQKMRENGIHIKAISPQNEPENPSNEPSMVMDASAQSNFIGEHLGPALDNASLGDVEIFCWDHNCDNREFPLEVMQSSSSGKYVDGAAWHLYAGDIGILSEVHSVCPDKKMYLTEQWTGRKGQFAGDFRWHMKTVLIGSIRNWSQAVFEWNLASDPSCDPHTPGGCPDCKGAVTISRSGKPQYQFNVSYYVIGHASKFVKPGSVRIFSDIPGNLPNVAFATPDGKIVLVVLNDSDEPKAFKIRWHGMTAVAWLNAGAAETFVWNK